MPHAGGDLGRRPTAPVRAGQQRAGAIRQRRHRRPPRAAPGATRYQVKQGDTLARIARQVKPADMSLDMMLVALYRANPDAFIGNNMNRLKSGQILSVPDARGGARRRCRRSAQHRGGAGRRLQRLPQASWPARSPPAPPIRPPKARQSATGRITGQG